MEWIKCLASCELFEELCINWKFDFDGIDSDKACSDYFAITVHFTVTLVAYEPDCGFYLLDCQKYWRNYWNHWSWCFVVGLSFKFPFIQVERRDWSSCFDYQSIFRLEGSCCHWFQGKDLHYDFIFLVVATKSCSTACDDNLEKKEFSRDFTASFIDFGCSFVCSFLDYRISYENLTSCSYYCYEWGFVHSYYLSHSYSLGPSCYVDRGQNSCSYKGSDVPLLD